MYIVNSVLCITVLYTVISTHMSSSYRYTRDSWLRFSLGYFVFCMFFLPRANFFGFFLCFFGVFSLVCVELSVLVQVIAWKDSSLE